MVGKSVRIMMNKLLHAFLNFVNWYFLFLFDINLYQVICTFMISTHQALNYMSRMFRDFLKIIIKRYYLFIIINRKEL